MILLIILVSIYLVDLQKENKEDILRSKYYKRLDSFLGY